MSAPLELPTPHPVHAARFFLLLGMGTMEIAKVMGILEHDAERLLHIGLASSRAAVFRNLKARREA